MEDKSKMRFIPIMKGYINDKEVKDQLYEHLKHQATSKAGEVKLEFKYYDVKAKKEYFQNKSIEQLIHEVATRDNEKVPLFKHISRKWSPQQNKQELEITVTSALVNEATTFL